MLNEEHVIKAGDRYRCDDGTISEVLAVDLMWVRFREVGGTEPCLFTRGEFYCSHEPAGLDWYAVETHAIRGYGDVETDKAQRRKDHTVDAIVAALKEIERQRKGLA